MAISTSSVSARASSPSSLLLSSSPASDIAVQEHAENAPYDLNMDPIAITGFSLKLPGDADSVESFWGMLMKGRSTASEFPKDRLNHASHHSADPGAMGSIRPRKAHFLKEDLAVFDSSFFNMSAAEVSAMDPQQRGLLETAYRALENAGLPMERIYGSDTSVHTGCFTADYLLTIGKDPELMPKYGGTGVAAAMLSNRISAFFNLHGPSVTIDTACSSSLVALDQACQSLRFGQSSLGIVAGCNLIFSLDTTIGLSNMGFLSPDGVSHSFDHRANGYARGEGFGVVIIKRFSDAVRDGDTIRAVIRATGTNQDGNTPLAQPSKEAQTRLITNTYRRAGLDPSETRYVEAHGTGTSVGDPLEAFAIGTSFAAGKPKSEAVYVSSLKANFGHLEGAAGIAGLIKTVLVLERGVIPPLANFEKSNPEIDTDFLNIKFPREPIPWPGRGLRRASVNSFGFGGTNAHAIVDDAYHYMQLRRIKGKHCTRIMPPDKLDLSDPVGNTFGLVSALGEKRSMRRLLLTWSAADGSSMKEMATSFKHWLSEAEDALKNTDILPSLAHSLLERRSLLSSRAFAVTDPLDSLQAIRISEPIQSRPATDLSLAFVFTGQGAQWCGMGRELFEYEAFRNSVLDAIFYLMNHGCYLHLAGVFTGQLEPSSKVDEPEMAQPVCTILQVALVDLLASINIRPSVVIGHSSGEIAAAYASGAFSREVAWKLAFFRGKCSSKLAKMPNVHGAMAAVGLPEAQVNKYIEKVTKDLDCKDLRVACVNSPINVTVSGTKEHVEALASRIEQDSFFARFLTVPVAYHGPHMNIVADEYFESIGTIDRSIVPQRSHATMVSSVTGEQIPQEDLRNPAYWVRNLVSQVKFAQAIEFTFSKPRGSTVKKLDLSHRNAVWATDILEIGPHSTLSRPIRDCLRSIPHGKTINYVSSLSRNKDASLTFLTAIAELYCRGYPALISKLNTNARDGFDHLISLPNLPQYPFNHTQSFWYESRLSRSLRFRPHGRDPFLGTPVADWNPQDARWRHFLKTEDAPWIADHIINGSIIYPAAGMLTMAMNAALQLSGDIGVAAFEFSDVTFHSGLDLSNEDSVEVQLQLIAHEIQPSTGVSKYDWRLRAYRSGWNEISRGEIRLVAGNPAVNEVDQKNEENHLRERMRSRFFASPKNYPNEIDGPGLYDRLWHCGYHFGSTFKRIRKAKHSPAGRGWAEVDLLDTQGSETPSVIHPATLDGILQIMLPGAAEGGKDSRLATSVPTRINRLWVSRNGLKYEDTKRIEVACATCKTGFRNTTSDIAALAQDGSLRVVGDGIETTSITDGTEEPLALSSHQAKLCFNIVYKPDIGLLGREDLDELLLQNAPTMAASSDYLRDLDIILYTLLHRENKRLNQIETRDVGGHLTQYRQWMQIQLGASNDEMSKAVQLSQDDEAFRCLYDSVGSQHPKRSGILYRSGEHLAEILSGRLDPLSLLFQGQDMPDFYENLLELSNFITPLSRWLDLVTHKNPDVTILEVGAGTGGATKHLMKTLIQHGSGGLSARYSRYCFTDISPSFFAQAREDFGYAPKLDFQTLNLEQDPLAQGFQPESYDIIFASLVLHATSSLDRSLTHLRTLLKPGGKLVAIEITTPESLSAGFAFGLLPGWWLSEDTYRENRLSPCLATHEWHHALTYNGFSGIDHEFLDTQDQQRHHISLLISTKLESEQFHISHERSATILAATGVDDCHLQLCKRGLESIGLEPTQADFAAIAATADPPSATIIIIDSISHPTLQSLGQDSFSNFRETLVKASNILWISETDGDKSNPATGAVYGLARTLRSENAALRFTIYEVDRSIPIEKQEKNFERVMRQCSDLSSSFPESEIAAKQNILHIPRAIEDVALNEMMKEEENRIVREDTKFIDGNLCLAVQTPGLLDSLAFVQGPSLSLDLGPREVQVRVRAIGVNFKDCLVALGRIADNAIGTDCAGIVEKVGPGCSVQPGDRVAVLALNTYSSVIRCDEDLVAKIPTAIPFTEAAKIPTNFVTAYHALIEIGRLADNESVLIHAGAGGTGQAAIQIAQLFGGNVFVTVGSKRKKELVMATYGIPEDHIFYSRDTSFAEGVKRQTSGRGVDLVLNSLAGEELMASWGCIAPYGRFLEIGKRDILSNKKLPMLQFARNISFAAIDIAAMIRERPHLIQKCLKPVVELVAQKRIRIASPLRVFDVHQVEDAFRYLQSGLNAGSVALNIAEDATVPALIPRAHDRCFDPEATYVIAGGLGGQGKSIARWMQTKGAKHLLLLSRTGSTSQSAKEYIAEMRELGMSIEAPPCNVADATALRRVIDSVATYMPPIRGCIQASMVIQDALFASMEYCDWATATGPKVLGSWNLHTVLPNDMDFFILLSSIGGVIGSGGQSNYAAGNTYQDALAAFRLAHGQKAVSLDLSVMPEAGYLEHHNDKMEQLTKMKKMIPMSQTELFKILEHYCNPDLRIEDIKGQVLMGLSLPSDLVSRGEELASWMERPLFSHLRHIESATANLLPTATQFSTQVNLSTLASAKSRIEAGTIITKAIQDKLARVLSYASEDIDTTKPMHAHGVDSLVAVELKNWFIKALAIDVPIFEILGGGAIEALGASVAEKLGFGEPE